MGMPIIPRTCEMLRFKQRYAENRNGNGENSVFYYGISGIGKTTFLKQIEQEIKEHEPYIEVIYIDCSLINHNIYSLLLEIANSVENSLGEKTFIKFHQVMQSLNSADYIEKAITDTVKNDVFPEAISSVAASVFAIFGGPAIGPIAKYTATVAANYLTSKKDSSDPEERIRNAFIEDLRTIEKELLIIIDSLERIFRNKDELRYWFDEISVHKQNNKVFWIFSGQDNYKDGIELQPFNIDYYWKFVSEILQSDTDAELLKKEIHNISFGIPYILSYLFDRISREGCLKADDFEMDILHDLHERYFMRFSVQKLTILGVLAYLGEWDDSLVSYIINELRCTNIVHWRIELSWKSDYKEIKELAFTKINDGVYSFYTNMRNVYKRVLADKDKTEIGLVECKYYQALKLKEIETSKLVKIFSYLKNRLSEETNKDTKKSFCECALRMGEELFDRENGFEYYKELYDLVISIRTYDIELTKCCSVRLLKKLLAFIDNICYQYAKHNILGILIENSSDKIEKSIYRIIMEKPSARYHVGWWDKENVRIVFNDILTIDAAIDVFLDSTSSINDDDKFLLYSRCLIEMYWQGIDLLSDYIDLYARLLNTSSRSIESDIVYLDGVNHLLIGTPIDSKVIQKHKSNVDKIIIGIEQFKNNLSPIEADFLYQIALSLQCMGIDGYLDYYKDAIPYLKNDQHLVRACRAYFAKYYIITNSDSEEVAKECIKYVDIVLSLNRYLSSRTFVVYSLIGVALRCRASNSDAYIKNLDIEVLRNIDPDTLMGLRELGSFYYYKVMKPFIYGIANTDLSIAKKWCLFFVEILDKNLQKNEGYYLEYLPLLYNTALFCFYTDDKSNYTKTKESFFSNYNSVKNVFKSFSDTFSDIIKNFKKYDRYYGL